MTGNALQVCVCVAQPEIVFGMVQQTGTRDVAMKEIVVFDLCNGQLAEISWTRARCADVYEHLQMVQSTISGCNDIVVIAPPTIGQIRDHGWLQEVATCLSRMCQGQSQTLQFAEDHEKT